ncbi:MFS transporter, partial [Desulfocurvibacter africanus]
MRKASSQVRAWAMYDWANSAYVLTTVTAVLPAYFATAVVPEAGAVLLGVRLAAPTLWGLMVGSAALLIF